MSFLCTTTTCKSFTRPCRVDLSSSYVDESPSAVLLVNTRGCGYPPKVSCEGFFGQFGKENHTFPCFYSKYHISIKKVFVYAWIGIFLFV